MTTKALFFLGSWLAAAGVLLLAGVALFTGWPPLAYVTGLLFCTFLLLRVLGVEEERKLAEARVPVRVKE